MLQFKVEDGDVTEVPSDLLLLKHAQGFYGADLEVAAMLFQAGICKETDLLLDPGQHVILEDGKATNAKRIMFMGAEPLSSLGYSEIFRFSYAALLALDTQGLPVRRLTTTVHGAGYGLDPAEAMRSLMNGFTEARRWSNSLVTEVVFVEHSERRARILAQALGEWHPREAPPGIIGSRESALDRGEHDKTVAPPASSARVGAVDIGITRPHIFVAMPFSEEFEDVYEFGIYDPVTSSGYACEHVGQAAFTGDILHQIKHRIKTAKLVIADLTGARPNVYLEVGFAWGCDIPVVIVAKQGEPLQFDVKTQRCVYYKNITHLKRELKQLLVQL